jgi:signal transduction histidine kinase
MLVPLNRPVSTIPTGVAVKKVVVPIQAALNLARSQEQIRALQEVDRSRRELLANVSHELRTPLSTILTESTAPLAKAEGLAGADRRLRAIAGEAQRLKALVDEEQPICAASSRRCSVSTIASGPDWTGMSPAPQLGGGVLTTPQPGSAASLHSSRNAPRGRDASS